MATLERWSLVGLDDAKPLAVRGEIHGDERFSDGTPITSSRLCNLDPGGHFACTRNHTYELGAMSDAFACWMTANGRTIASFAAALDAKATGPTGKTTPKTTRSSATVHEATRVVPAATSRATALVQTPTLVANG